MSYRDDLDAAHSRADSLQRQVVALEKLSDRSVDRPSKRRVDWGALAGPTIGLSMTGTFTVLAIVLGWGTGWAIAGFVLSGLMTIGLLATGPTPVMPDAPAPIRIALDIACQDGRAQLSVIALVRPVIAGGAETKAREMFLGKSTTEVAAAATVVIEATLRQHLATVPLAALDGGAVTTTAQPPVRDALGRAGLALETFWLGRP